jgi:hypothetical protein
MEGLGFLAKGMLAGKCLPLTDMVAEAAVAQGPLDQITTPIHVIPEVLETV